MKRAMERHQKSEVRVIPIILRPVHWQDAPFGKLQVLPKGAIPVVSSKWHNSDEAFLDIIDGIRQVIKQLTPCIISNISERLYRHTTRLLMMLINLAMMFAFNVAVLISFIVTS